MHQRRSFARWVRLIGLAALIASFIAATASAGRSLPEPPPVFDKALPEGIDDLKAMQEHVKKVVDRVMPCTVAVQVGQAQGSGVIIDKEGHILTAAHVSGKAGQKVRVIFPDGRIVRGITLGADVGVDAGLIQIAEEGVEFRHAAKGQSADLKRGQWIITIGHPGGYQKGRPPVVRVGRVLNVSDRTIRTDCPLVGGDSGGPLFDMHGHVVGIHSRIGAAITYNIHVPIDAYTAEWDRLSAGEVWGSPFLGVGTPMK